MSDLSDKVNNTLMAMNGVGFTFMRRETKSLKPLGRLHLNKFIGDDEN